MTNIQRPPPDRNPDFDVGLEVTALTVGVNLQVEAVSLGIPGVGQILLGPGAAASMASALVASACRVRREQWGKDEVDG